MDLTEKLIVTRKYLRMCRYRADAVNKRRTHISATTAETRRVLAQELEKAEKAVAAAEKEYEDALKTFTRALDRLVSPLEREILTYRYIYEAEPRCVMKALSISRSTYYRRLDAALGEVNA